MRFLLWLPLHSASKLLFAGIRLHRAQQRKECPPGKINQLTIFNEAFASVGLPYFNPHSSRKASALLGGQRCRTPEEYKAWSQNLGHEHVLTTFCGYGDVSGYRESEIMRSLASPLRMSQDSAANALLLSFRPPGAEKFRKTTRE